MNITKSQALDILSGELEDCFKDASINFLNKMNTLNDMINDGVIDDYEHITTVRGEKGVLNIIFAIYKDCEVIKELAVSISE